MFTDFLYMLRAYGMDTSLNEWNLLLEALNSNLNECSLDEFYHMSRCILVKKVADYDRFDQAFAAYFKNIRNMDALPPQVMKWLAKTMSKTPFDKEEVDALWENKTLEEIAPFGIRVYGGEHGTRRSALEVAGERRFRDFRDDNTMQIRDFQVAFKKLRLLSMRDDGRKTEFNVDRTIEETGKKAGMLQIVMERPRKNQTKLLLLMDSGGSMWSYTDLCSRLFNAVHQSSHFKDLQIYYFHNCVYDEVYKTPECLKKDSVPTQWLLDNLKPEYKVIYVGDASMAPAELYDRASGFDYFRYDSAHYMNDFVKKQRSGEEWLRLLKKRFPASVWLNPLHVKLWAYDNSMFTVNAIRKIIPMYQLSPAGLDKAIQRLKNPTT